MSGPSHRKKRSASPWTPFDALPAKWGHCCGLTKRGEGTRLFCRGQLWACSSPHPKPTRSGAVSGPITGRRHTRGLGEQWPVGLVVREATDRSVCRTLSGVGAKNAPRKGHPAGLQCLQKTKKISKSHPKPAWPKVGRRSPDGRWLPGRGSLWNFLASKNKSLPRTLSQSGLLALSSRLHRPSWQPAAGSTKRAR